VDPRHVVPFDAAVRPMNVNGAWKLRVTWRVVDIPPVVSGWKIYVGDPHGNTTQAESALLDEVVSSKNYKKAYFDVAYTMKGDYPLSWCARVVTQLGQTAHSDPSDIVCPPAQAPSQPAQKPAPGPAPAQPATKPAAPPKPAAKPTPKH
jgi:hypothetical protein